MKLTDIRTLTAQLTPELAHRDPALYNSMLRSLGYEPGNLYQELEMESKYVDTHQDTSWNNANVSLHSHTFYELLYCRSSCDVEYLVGSDRYRLQKGDVILVPPGVSHRPILPETMDQPYMRDVLWINPEFVNSLSQTFPGNPVSDQDRRSPMRTAGTRWESIGKLFRNGVREAENQAPGWELAVIGNTMQLLTQIKRATDDQNARMLKAEQPELLDRITSYVEEHYTGSVTIGDLAKCFFVSPSTISHLFQQRLGVSFHRYVTQRRLIDAKNRIVKGQRLEEVAGQTGFSDYSSFYRAFRQQFGISPRQYRLLQEKDAKNG